MLWIARTICKINEHFAGLRGLFTFILIISVASQFDTWIYMCIIMGFIWVGLFLRILYPLSMQYWAHARIKSVTEELFGRDDV